MTALRAAVVATALLLLVGVAPAEAATLTVTSNGDTGPGTLREKVGLAQPGDTVLVPGGMTIALTSQITVAQVATGGGLTIAATGSGTPTVSGGTVTRLFDVSDHVSFTVNGLKLMAGSSPASEDGGAIRSSDHDTIAIANSALTNNTTAGSGGAIHMESPGRLTVTNSTVDGNSAPSSDGGAIYMSNPGTLTIAGSRFTANHAQFNGGAIHLNHPSTAKITNSTFDGNYSSGSDGGAIQINGDSLTVLSIAGTTFINNHADSSDGGALKINQDSHLDVTNSTFKGNTAAGRGGAAKFDSDVTVRFLNSTLSDNHAGATQSGGAVYLDAGLFNDFAFKNSIVSGNTAQTGPNCFAATAGQIHSQGHNIEQGTSCGFTAAGDKNADPMLGALASNGGSTQTMSLLPGSPAIDAGDNSGCPATDQRGIFRPQHGTCEMGAFEVVTPPGCSLVDASAGKLKLTGKKTKKGRAGALSLVARCDEAAAVNLGGSATITTKVKKKGSKKTKTRKKTVKLASISGQIPANVSTTLRVLVPASAVKALQTKGAKGSAAFDLTATNPSGTGTAHADVAKLKAPKAKKKHKKKH